MFSLASTLLLDNDRVTLARCVHVGTYGQAARRGVTPVCMRVSDFACGKRCLIKRMTRCDREWHELCVTATIAARVCLFIGGGVSGRSSGSRSNGVSSSRNNGMGSQYMKYPMDVCVVHVMPDAGEYYRGACLYQQALSFYSVPYI